MEPTTGKRGRPVKDRTVAEERGMGEAYEEELRAAQELSRRNVENRFAVIRLEQKRMETDMDYAIPCVNGENMQLKRGVPVPVPYSIVIALRNAKQPIYKQQPGQERMHVGETSRFPLSILRDNISRRQYEVMRDICRDRELTEQEIDDICSQPYEAQAV